MARGWSFLLGVAVLAACFLAGTDGVSAADCRNGQCVQSVFQTVHYGGGQILGQGHQRHWLIDHPSTRKALAIINAHRARYGRHALILDLQMSQQAWNHSRVQCMRGQHHSRLPYAECVFVYGGSIQGAMAGFFRSPPHNGIILGGFRRIGIGYASMNGRRAWTLVFR